MDGIDPVNRQRKTNKNLDFRISGFFLKRQKTKKDEQTKRERERGKDKKE